MTDRFVAVLAPAPGTPSAAPPGLDPEAFRLAMIEDAYEVAAGLDFVLPALILAPPGQPAAEEIVWPGTEIVRTDSRPIPAALARFQALGAAQAVIVAGDAPDIPALHIGKLFRALTHAPAAAAQAHKTAGPAGLVALGVRLPLPEWLAGALQTIDLDTPDAFAALRAAAPRSGLVQSAPGWHRLRTRADINRLDPGLEGWENTRALLTGRPLG